VIAGAAQLFATAHVTADTRSSAKQDQAALAQLAAAYQPIARAASGADRTRQACADAAAVQTAASSTPKRAPAKAAIDDSVWDDMATRVKLELEDLVEVCKAPDHKLQMGTKTLTADGVAASVDDHIRALLDAARSRDLPPAMKKFQTTMTAMRPAGKQLCAQHRTLTRLLPQFATPPDQVDAARWQQAHASLTESLDELKQFGCAANRHAFEEIAGSMHSVHDGYYKLVLLLPARS
jgi:hypothetical protein